MWHCTIFKLNDVFNLIPELWYFHVKNSWLLIYAMNVVNDVILLMFLCMFLSIKGLSFKSPELMICFSITLSISIAFNILFASIDVVVTTTLLIPVASHPVLCYHNLQRNWTSSPKKNAKRLLTKYFLVIKNVTQNINQGRLYIGRFQGSLDIDSHNDSHLFSPWTIIIFFIIFEKFVNMIFIKNFNFLSSKAKGKMMGYRFLPLSTIVRGTSVFKAYSTTIFGSNVPCKIPNTCKTRKLN